MPCVWRLRGSALRLHSSGRAAHSRRNGLSPAPPVPAAPESATFSIQHKKNAVHHTSCPLNTIKSRSLAPAAQPRAGSRRAVQKPTSFIPNKALHPQQGPSSRTAAPHSHTLATNVDSGSVEAGIYPYTAPEPSPGGQARHHPKTNLPPTHSKTPLSLPCSDTAIFVRRKLPS